VTPLTREEFNRNFAAVVRAIREARGVSQKEPAASLRANATPTTQREDEYLRSIAAISAVTTCMREERGLTIEQLAKRSHIPVEFVRNLEAKEDLKPDAYFLHCMTCGLGVSFSQFWRRVEGLLAIPENELQKGNDDEGND
jgi:ribosome-binding protein aMBF1 (putative translation factor)